MNILHFSALPLWSMDGKAGMPSLIETINGHIKNGNIVEIILPEFDLFSTDLNRVKIEKGSGFKIHIAPCPWLPFFKKIKLRLIKNKPDNEIPYLFRWLINFNIIIFFTFTLLFKAFKIQKTFKPDLIYANNQYSAIAAFLMARYLKTPNVTRLYGTFLADLIKKPFVFLRYPTASAGYLVPSSLIICANDGTRGDEVAKKFKIPEKRFKFWQNGISPPESKPEIEKKDFLKKLNIFADKDTKIAVSCSRLSSWKRIDRIIHAIKYCTDNGGKILLLIAGDGPEKNFLEKLARDLGIEKNIVFLGSVSHEKIWGLMNISDIFMITNDVTNRCNPLFEAAWAGLPIVSVKDNSTKDLIVHNKNGLLSDKDDNLALGSNLLKILKNKELRDKFINEQKNISSKFSSWDQRMKKESIELKKLIKG